MEHKDDVHVVRLDSIDILEKSIAPILAADSDDGGDDPDPDPGPTEPDPIPPDTINPT